MDENVSPLDYDNVMKISEIAKKFKVNSNTVTRWCKEGHFPNAFKVGSSWRIPRTDLENYIKKQTEGDKRRFK